MSSNSPSKLRNEETLIPTSSGLVTNHSRDNSNSDMENTEYLTNEQAQPKSDSPSSSPGSLQANEERLNHLQNEMVTLKAMMGKLFEQNEEKNRQSDVSATTSSFGVRASNSELEKRKFQRIQMISNYVETNSGNETFDTGNDMLHSRNNFKKLEGFCHREALIEKKYQKVSFSFKHLNYHVWHTKVNNEV